MIRRLLLCALIALMMAVPAAAQGPRTLLWDAPPDVTTLATANQFAWLLTVNNGATPIAVTSATCTGTTAPFQCAAPVPASVPAVFDTKLELQARTPGGAVSSKSIPFMSPTAAPSNVRTVLP